MKFVRENLSRGFTLIEVLISLVILAIILLASASLMDTLQEQNWFNYHFSVANFLAQDKLEELQNLKFSTTYPLADTTPSWSAVETLTMSGQPSSTGFYSRQWKIAPGTGGKQLKARIQWQYKNKRVHQVELKTFKAPD